MQLICDTHVHLYPCYDLREAFARGIVNLNRREREFVAERGATDEPSLKALCLTERRDCRYFAALRSGEARFGPDCSFVPAAEEGGLVLETEGTERLVIIAGRQIVTAERLEVLCLTADLDIEDGLPAEQAVERVLSAGAVPVLPWSPGKWMFGRGKSIEVLLKALPPDRVLIGDPSLRPAGWEEPKLISLAREIGFQVVCGSDPLPFPGEERRLGSYATAIRGAGEPQRPVSSIRRLLVDGTALRLSVGRRGSPLSVARRLLRNAWARKSGR